MKKLLLSILIFLAGYSAVAQKIRFTDTTNVWHYYFWDNANVSYYSHPYTDKYSGDTIYHGVPYHKLVVGIGTTVLIREDTTAGKVYVVPMGFPLGALPIDTTEHVLYDYTLAVGDTFYYTGATPHIVDSLSSVIINGAIHRVWYLKPINDSFQTGLTPESYNVIEGIGCDIYSCFPISPYGFEGNMTLTCFNNNGTTPPLSAKVGYYFDNASSCELTFGLGIHNPANNPQAINVYPNPAQNELIVSSATAITQVAIFNLVGQTIYSNNYNADKVAIDISALHPGIYFVRVNDIDVQKFAKE